MYTLTIHCPDAAALAEAVNKLAGSAPAPQAAPKKAGVKTPESAKAHEAGEFKPEVVEFASVKAAVLEVAKIKGREASLDLLAKFGVVSGEGDNRKGDMKGLKGEQYAEVVAEAKRILAEE